MTPSVGNGSTTQGTSFPSIFLISFLTCSSISTEYVNEISKGYEQPLAGYDAFCRKWQYNSSRYEFFINSFSYFLIFSSIATEYVYEISKGYAQPLASYDTFAGNGSATPPGTSFSSILLILFLIFSSIATK
jgi:hypothetical protein